MKYGLKISMTALAALAAANLQAGWSDQVNVSGSAIFEAGMTSGDYLDDSFDMRLFEFFMGIDAKLNDKVSASVGLLYEEGDAESTNFDVDTGYLTLQMSDNASVQLGLMGMPFGSFNTNMINDPFALVLGETVETGAAFHWNADMLGMTAYLFNGNVHEVGDDDTANSFGFRVMAGSEDMNVTLDYINNMVDADNYSGGPYPENNIAVSELVGGFALAGHAGMGNMTFDVEYMSALDPIGGVGGNEVESFGAEFGMTMGGHCECAFGVAMQTSDEAVGILPETRFSIGYTRPIMDVLTLNTELYMDSDYDVADGGTGDDGTGLLVHVAASF